MSFTWNPSPIAFTLPFIHWPVTWYGICFVSGIILNFFLLTYLLAHTLEAKNRFSSSAESHAFSLKIVDRFLWYMMVSIVIGARLGHVLFYAPTYYWNHPLDILKIWQGGLASHGAALSIPIALWLFYSRYKHEIRPLTFIQFFDIFAMCVPLSGTFIRIGNFVNQEIVGTPTNLPWAITFLHPLDPIAAVPRHPVQLYEAIVYFIIFFLLFFLWKNKLTQKVGILTGLLFILMFTSRFFLEFFKSAQGDYFTSWQLQTGQLLSLPFMGIGLLLLVLFRKNKRNNS